MAIGGSDLSLLFKLRAQNEASPAIRSVQADVAKLKTAFGQDFGQMQGIANSALSSVTTNLTRLSSNLPIVGTAVNGLASSLGTMAGEGTAAAGSLAAIAGPASLAVVGVAALAAGVIALHKGLFTLAENAAGFRGKLFDLSQQTGVEVETLNALEIGLSKVGGNIDSAAQSLIVFQDKLGEAQDASSKAGKQFAELGISTDNTEQALRDALKALAAMPEGFRQTNAAAELFGRRGGKQFLALLKETNGDIDAAVEKLGDLAGVTKAEAKAADDLLDALRDLNILFRGAFGKEAIPAATDAVKDLTKVLKDNEDAFKAIGFGVGVLSTLLGGEFKRSLQVISELWRQAEAPVRVVAQAYERLAEAMERVGLIAATLPQVGAGVSIGGTGFTKKGTGVFGGGADAASALDAHQPLGVIDRARRGGRSAATDPSIAFMAQLGAEVKRLTDSLNGLDTKTREYRVNQEILNGALAKALPEVQSLALAQAQQLDSADKFAAQVEKITKFQNAQNEAVRLAIEGEKGHIRVTEEFIAALEKEGIQLSETIKKRLRLNAAILANVEAIKMLAETIENLPPLLAGEGGGEGLGDDVIGKLAGAAANAQLGPPPEVIQSWIDLKGTALDAMFSMAQAVGQLTQQWVLYGDAGPNAIKKMVAAVLAGVAAEAAVRAVMELAYGFAALTPWGAAIYGPAPLHFKSAALFASVAAGAALGGRAIAGGAFASAGSGGGGGGSGGSPQALQTIVQGRNQPQQQQVTIRLVSDLGELRKVIVGHVVEDIRDAGQIREILANDGG